MQMILVVEDDPAIAHLIELYLQNAGYAVSTAKSGPQGLHMFEDPSTEFDLVLLDLMLPGLDGRGVCRRIRMTSEAPIIMVTALDDSRDKLEGFDYGADDYVTKPFDPEELVARVKAVLRRVRTNSTREDTDDLEGNVHVGNLSLNPDGYLAEVAGRPLHLTLREFQLLLTLSRNRGMVLSRSHFVQKIWHEELSSDSRSVDVHISRLREKLVEADATVQIEALRGVGYRLVETP